MKKILSFCLCLLLVASLNPLSAQAYDSPEVEGELAYNLMDDL